MEYQLQQYDVEQAPLACRGHEPLQQIFEKGQLLRGALPKRRHRELEKRQVESPVQRVECDAQSAAAREPLSTELLLEQLPLSAAGFVFPTDGHREHPGRARTPRSQ